MPHFFRVILLIRKVINFLRSIIEIARSRKGLNSRFYSINKTVYEYDRLESNFDDDRHIRCGT